MSDGRCVFNVLKESGTSRFVKSLTPDSAVPNVKRAIALAESQDVKKRVLPFHQPRNVSRGCHFAYTLPEQRPHYRTLLKSVQTHADMDLKMDEKLEKLLSGEQVYYDESQGIFPYSTAYAGFQFGTFAGQLGDGRVVNLFDVQDNKGNWQTLQLKGSGLTPFSRFADGKAVLRSSIRELIISEALYHIGVPSSRALQLTLLPETRASRERKSEPCAVLCRVAPTWLRIGSFDLFRFRPHLKGLLGLTHFAIDEVFNGGKDFPRKRDLNIFRKDFFPNDGIEQGAEARNPVEGSTIYDEFYRHVINLNAKCVASWQTYGFMNGVLNTDNTSIMGLSLDYGPFNIMDQLKPDFTPNHDDIAGRYSFENQPSAIWWNLIMLGHDLSVLIGAGPSHIDKILSMQELSEELPAEVEKEVVNRANDVIALAGNEYKFTFLSEYANLMGKRIGIDLGLSSDLTNAEEIAAQSSQVHDFLSNILEPLLNILETTEVDYNHFFVKLQNYRGPLFDDDGAEGLSRSFLSLFLHAPQIEQLQAFKSGEIDINADSGGVRIVMGTVERLSQWAKEYVKFVPDEQKRSEIAKEVNPLFTPRAWMFDEVVDDFMDNQRTELNDPESKIDNSLLSKLFLMSSNPYDPSKWEESLRPDVQERWMNLEHESIREKYLKQATCSS
ncbi:ZYRO0E07480p [Zygosaccharomyces rouxii]|uniref:Selenoprotein O n=1 Tax=Zygosaccharomyces rouxii (strain ATCC 2623 / CBS 732 / NBRC 1130 / NCYC 568 / NRRL Y-229) TaxID=559307 RepID=C5E4N3_ZYGRC|nr:uncharacterized protein ZYRO0E07480g [Zygosaccharomyces rouxii]KAH9198150.1 hypothetical protein LQ764DRAFT_147716 [Zygosaccharomyces rouxii]CAR30994.1 ZYRO0E07480p [Zygosaccharomyces rouxii]